MFIFDTILEKTDGISVVTIPSLGIEAKGEGSETALMKTLTTSAQSEVRRRLLMEEPIEEATFSMPELDGSKTCFKLVLDVDFPEEEYCTVKDAMAVLSVSQPRISSLIKAGKLDSIREGRQHLITRSSLINYSQTPRRPGRPRKEA